VSHIEQTIEKKSPERKREGETDRQLGSKRKEEKKKTVEE